MNILITSLAPVFIILFYVYSRDKYEKEPWKLLLKALIAGGLVRVC
jgi:RsiW-degrading membrane proteinase PrsW (M82 family)